MPKQSWNKYKDDITKATIHVLNGHGWTEGLQARVFQERTDLKYAKETRYFPQINDDQKERVIIIGDDRIGYKTLTEAKTALIEEFADYVVMRNDYAQYLATRKDQDGDGKDIEYLGCE